uniref:BTB domain-containing protein n=1 Tax=Panagrolaimus sp. ES5 TaxID=591445 RepID=A0AC34GLX5_9BILA
EIFKSQDPDLFDVTFEIEGKKLYADKYVLSTISEPFGALFSNRWAKTDEIIKIENYSFDNFYQFLSFIYSGECEINEENVTVMVDLAEYYDIAVLKKCCDENLAKLECEMDKFLEMLELAQTYSLTAFLTILNKFAVFHFHTM